MYCSNCRLAFLQKNLRLLPRQAPLEGQMSIQTPLSGPSPSAEFKQKSHEDTSTLVGYGAAIFQHLNTQKPGIGSSQSPVSDDISSPDGSQPHTPPPSITPGPHSFEYEELKQQVERLQAELYRYKQREAQERITHHTMEEIVGPASDGDHILMNSVSTRPTARIFQSSVQPLRPFVSHVSTWAPGLAGGSNLVDDNSKGLAWPSRPSSFGPIGCMSSNAVPTSGLYPNSFPCAQSSPAVPSYHSLSKSGFAGILADYQSPTQDVDSLSGSSMGSGGCSNWQLGPSDSNPFNAATGQNSGETTTSLATTTSFGSFSPKVSQDMCPGSLPLYTAPVHSVNGIDQSEAAVNCASLNTAVGSNWNNRIQSGNSVHEPFSAHSEPLNYRRLLEKDADCNWDYVVEKIVSSNDQQASIFLQQKLKIGSSYQKHEIVEAILKQCYPLMINRFGNFLVQRCFEHGTPQQIVNIAHNIRTHTVSLSMDPFGCHVVQKALDCVPEEFKACFVGELLRRIPETVIHRYACHVWQKLFELHWAESPPQIMKHVNDSLRGMWHEVALGETGSLVVQNIFENCVEEDKRPCIDEVLASIDVISRGQFGNWCIQHICENGLPGDKARAIEHVICYAIEYSVDQYASKVIEKCLKVGGNDFFDKYLTRVCEARSDRPRMPLIDIAGDQFGNYLIQYILANASSQHRELVATHVRKHMVSLRGSKYGSRVAMLCSNPSTVTRPGPPSNSYAGRYNGRGYRANHYP